MSFGTVTVFGGSGFIGRRIVVRLARTAAQVRVAVRHPERVRAPPEMADGTKLVPIHADVRDEASIAAAVAGASAVVNSVSTYVEGRGITFADIHERGAAAVARAANEAGVARLVHMSGIGTDPRSAAKYVRSRAEGEVRVKAAFPQATIVRPGVIFGPGDAFVNSLAGVARMSPVFPLIGGQTRLQPVYVEDVAEAVVHALADDTARGATYELGGPRIYTLGELVRLVLGAMGRTRLLFPVPFPLAAAAAQVAEVLPSPPLTMGQVELLRHDNVVGDTARTLRDLGITPTAFEPMLPLCLGRQTVAAR